MKFSSILVCAAALAALSGPALAKSHMPMCKGATVYAITADRVYFTRGMTHYGNMKGGTYMCEAAAKAKGYHKATMSMMKSSH